jgi:ankyrin repeat protein
MRKHIAAWLLPTVTILASLTTQFAYAGLQDGHLDAALFRVLRNADRHAVGSLLGKGANVNAKGEDGNTPLHYAALYAGADCMKLLLD